MGIIQATVYSLKNPFLILYRNCTGNKLTYCKISNYTFCIRK